MDPFAITIVTIVFTLIFSITNGWNDAANAIATAVSTRVLKPAVAVAFSAVLNFAGAFFSSEVAKTVGRDIADPQFLTAHTFLAAVIIAPLWITYCTWRGLPISCSHSLMGGLIGAVLATEGAEALKSAGMQKIAFGVIISPIAGFIGGYILILLVMFVAQRWRPANVTRVFGKLQIVSAAAMSFSHGTGDGQKAMGIMTGALIAGGFIQAAGDEFPIPLWTRIAAGLTMALGTAMGGRRVIKTLGMRIAHLRPYHGFAAETAAAATILVNTLTGVPISTTHSATGAILGVGSARGFRAVRWGVGGKIMFAWVVTFPVCVGGGAGIYWLLHRFLAG